MKGQALQKEILSGEREKERDSDRETVTERQRQRETETERDRESEREMEESEFLNKTEEAALRCSLKYLFLKPCKNP